MKLEGKTAIVTGAGVGLGAGIAQRLFNDGAHVVFADINPDNCQKQVDEIDPSGTGTLVLKTDVTDEQQVEAMVLATVKKFGTVDILVNNAGIDRKSTRLPVTLIYLVCRLLLEKKNFISKQ